MRKLNILKSLVDFLWFVTCIPLIPLGLFFSIFIFINNDIIKTPFEFNGSELEAPEIYIKILIVLLIMLTFIVIYCFYLFRKTLRYFQRRKPFDEFVIFTFNKTGYLLIFSGISSGVLIFVFQLLFESRVRLNLGLSPYLFIIVLGLFFMVLSEIFKIAKTAKEENDLTI